MDEPKKVSKAQQKATNKYIAKAYDRVNLTLPKGKKEEVQEQAKNQNESLNSFINLAIDKRIIKEYVTESDSFREVTGITISPYCSIRAGRHLSEHGFRIVLVEKQIHCRGNNVYVLRNGIVWIDIPTKERIADPVEAAREYLDLHLKYGMIVNEQCERRMWDNYKGLYYWIDEDKNDYTEFNSPQDAAKALEDLHYHYRVEIMNENINFSTIEINKTKDAAPELLLNWSRDDWRDIWRDLQNNRKPKSTTR